jgi:hypothetical protein
MRIWDVAPAYLNRQSLLGEHRELHGLHSILVNGKKGYSRHPETLRWVGRESSLARRHAFLVAEMRLRGYVDRTPIHDAAGPVRWPAVFVTTAAGQFDLLRRKYVGALPGRVPLPANAQELWASHKYSVLARDVAAYRSIGRRVARMRRHTDFSSLAEELVTISREHPRRGGLADAVEHMWGHVSKLASKEDKASVGKGISALLATTQTIATRTRDMYLLNSTALSELAVFAHRNTK